MEGYETGTRKDQGLAIYAFKGGKKMIEFLKLTEEQRRGMIGVIDYTQGIPEKAVEKDWWVTLTLKALFTGKYKDYIVFKGGTSLSKCWKLIERFSEDIDIALNPEAFGVSYETDPSKSFVTNLKKKGCRFTSEELKQDLEDQFKKIGIPEGMLEITAEPISDGVPDKDPQTLFVKYKSLYEPSAYLADHVKIEVSVRSQNEPSSSVPIQSLIGEATHVNKDAYKEDSFEVVSVEPHRTFLEKLFLLHEEFLKPDKAKIKAQRMSRHLYDIRKMMNHETSKSALADETLYKSIIKHREKYSRLGWVDYNTLERETISFLPSPEVLELYKADYKSMREEMIYGNSPEFEEIIDKLNQLTYRIRPTKNPPIKTHPGETPSYKFYKNYNGWKSETWRVDLSDTHKYILLHSVDYTPADAKSQLTLEIKVENENAADETYKFPLSSLEKGAAQGSDTLFFMIDGQNPIAIKLKFGRSWVTYKITGDKELEEYELILNSTYQ